MLECEVEKIPDSPQSLSPVSMVLALLNYAYTLLSRIEPSPSRSTLRAQDPLTYLQVEDELLEHSDMHVQVAVVSCISEIARIMTSDLPYHEVKMKEIFKVANEVYKRLDAISPCSFVKKVTILSEIMMHASFHSAPSPSRPSSPQVDAVLEEDENNKLEPVSEETDSVMLLKIVRL